MAENVYNIIPIAKKGSVQRDKKKACNEVIAVSYDLEQGFLANKGAIAVFMPERDSFETSISIIIMPLSVHIYT